MSKYPAGSPGSDIAALQGAGIDTRDVGTGNTTFNAAEVGRLTGSSSSQAASAGHSARNDMQSAGNMGISPTRSKS